VQSDDYQTCSGPMMTTTETVRRGLVTDEEFAKYQLETVNGDSTSDQEVEFRTSGNIEGTDGINFRSTNFRPSTGGDDDIDQQVHNILEQYGFGSK